MITKTLRVMESVACVATAIVLTGLPVWSQPGEQDVVQQRAVSYSGLDLNGPSGARRNSSRVTTWPACASSSTSTRSGCS